MFIYPIYNNIWRNISTIHIHITRLASNEIFSPSNKIHREIGRAKDLPASPVVVFIGVNSANNNEEELGGWGGGGIHHGH
jgi:hypothetical protein